MRDGTPCIWTTPLLGIRSLLTNEIQDRSGENDKERNPKTGVRRLTPGGFGDRRQHTWHSGSRQAVVSSVMNPLCRFKPVAPHAFTFDVHAPEIEEGLLMLVDAARELRFGNSVIILTL